jgi:hypothetical protein
MSAAFTIGDQEIRKPLLKYIRHISHAEPDPLIIEELGLCQGSSRVDVALIGKQHIAGYEIKSERDSLVRLPGQIHAYSRVFDKVTIVVATAHVQKVVEAIPTFWGIVEAMGVTDSVIFSVVRPPDINTSVDPYAVAQLLWRDEALDILNGMGLARGIKSKPREAIWRRLVENTTHECLRGLVRERLGCRNNWRVEAKVNE